jgi:hypothetical protein
VLVVADVGAGGHGGRAHLLDGGSQALLGLRLRASEEGDVGHRLGEERRAAVAHGAVGAEHHDLLDGAAGDQLTHPGWGEGAAAASGHVILAPFLTRRGAPAGESPCPASEAAGAVGEQTPTRRVDPNPHSTVPSIPPARPRVTDSRVISDTWVSAPTRRGRRRGPTSGSGSPSSRPSRSGR